jgi:hypothetical protein
MLEELRKWMMEWKNVNCPHGSFGEGSGQIFNEKRSRELSILNETA